MMNTPFLYLRGEYRTEPVPPEPDRLMAHIDTALEQHIFDLSQRKRISDVHHHREADHLGRAVEITEGIGHPKTLRDVTTWLKPSCSDNAVSRLWPETSKSASASWAKLQDPTTHRLIGDIEIALSQQILDISQTQCETAIEPNSILDNLRRKAMATI